MKKIFDLINLIIAAGYSATMFGCPIDAGNAFDCTAPVQPGIKSRLILYNWDDWKAGILTETPPGPITDYVNASTLQGWSFDVADEGNLIASSALVAVDGGADGFTHSIDSKAFKVDPASASQITKMRFQKIVAIIERNDGTAKVYGRNVGMRLSDFQFNEGTQDTGGVIQYVLSTPDGVSPEIDIPSVIDAGTPQLTVALLDTLTTPGV